MLNGCIKIIVDDKILTFELNAILNLQLVLVKARFLGEVG